jgi:hypothetical protein
MDPSEIAGQSRSFGSNFDPFVGIADDVIVVVAAGDSYCCWFDAMKKNCYYHRGYFPDEARMTGVTPW